MKLNRTVTTSTLVLAIVTALALAGPRQAMAQASAPSCADEARSHEFDFWIGEWDVSAGGKTAGTNSIRPILDGCVLQETWAGAGGSAGSSFNFYDPSRKQWRQLWVWRNGTTLELSGGYVDGRMILSGTSTTAKGVAVDNRITWYDNDDGSVRQHWEISTDGETWATSFDGLYRKRS